MKRLGFKQHFLLVLLITFLWSSSLHAKGHKEEPLLAGNIIAFSGVNVPAGEADIQAYFYATRLRGIYDSDGNTVSALNVHQYQLEVDFEIGLTPHIALRLETFAFDIHNNGRDTFHWGDTNLFFCFQVLKDKKATIIPDIRFFVGEVLPSGKHQNLDESFNGGDGVGLGTYRTLLIFIASKTYDWKHPFNWTLNIFYFIPSRVNVKGRNVYIDDPDIRGRVYPGVQFEVDLAFQYKFNRPWGCGIDLYLQQQNRSSFRQSSLLPLDADIPSTLLFSLAPSLQYNPCEKLNLLLGSWFTVLGRNSTAFTSLVFSVYYQF